MTTLAKHIIVARAENLPPMLENLMYDSWASRIHLFIKGKKNGWMMLDSIDNGLLVYPTIEENGQTRPKKYSELIEAQQLQDDCDVQATNIILHGLPPDVYALVNHQESAKDIWDRVKLLMKGELLYEYYYRFSQLINDMHTFGMTMQQVQVNTKFLNALPPEWSKFVTDAKYPDPFALVANSQTLYNPSQSLQHLAEFPQLDFGLAVPTFHQGEDPIECINKTMAFLSAMASRFPPLNNQLRTSSNPIIRQLFKMEESSFNKFKEDKLRCYNFLGKGHMAKQCTQPKRPRSSAWFKEKLMLVEAQEAGQILVEEQLAFIADLGIAEVQVAQSTIP
ncbi:hypothetical protein Tco_0484702 [Tanacetum coccineum]